MTEDRIYIQPEAHDHFHVILVEPEDNLNIGSVARAMMNLGFNNLHIVRPCPFDFQRASITARWAAPLLEKAVFHDTLEEALSSMQQVVGFALRGGRNQTEYRLLPEWVQKLQDGEEQSVRTALLFGPEDTGLRNEHLEQCRLLVRIPTTEEYPALNLAQSVVVTLYQLSRMQHGALHTGGSEQQPEWFQYNQLDRLVTEAALRSGFYDKDSSPYIPGLIKSLFRRIDPNEREIRVLLALFSRLNKALAGKIPISPLPEERGSEEG